MRNIFILSLLAAGCLPGLPGAGLSASGLIDLKNRYIGGCVSRGGSTAFCSCGWGSMESIAPNNLPNLVDQVEGKSQATEDGQRIILQAAVNCQPKF